MARTPDQLDGPEEEYDTQVNKIYTEINGLPVRTITVSEDLQKFMDNIVQNYLDTDTIKSKDLFGNSFSKF